jgi:flagellar hook-associated protein 2
MSDVYIPGVKSRFNTDQIIEDLMRLEQIPRDRVQRNVDNLQVQRGYWQEVGRRVSAVRESARLLYSFQNPFSDRIARSADDSVITASTTREAAEQSYSFIVKQTASADRFLSRPLEERSRIEAGTYAFTVGNDEISINFRGGTLNDFVEIINRRGRDKIGASLIAVQPGTKSLLIESKVTGAGNRLGFSGDSTALVTRIGMMEQGNDTQRSFAIADNTVQKSGENSANISVNEGVIQVSPRATASIPLGVAISADSPLVLKLETQTRQLTDDAFIPQPPPGPSIEAGSVTYGGITIENEPSDAPLPEWTPPATPQRVDDMAVLSLVFSDGSTAKLPEITDTNNFSSRQFNLAPLSQGKTIASLSIENNNTHRAVSVGKIEILDPASTSGGLRPLNSVATARDAVIMMEGIEITRPGNNIDDLVPGITLNLKGASERPVELSIRADTEGAKDAIIKFVGNYNRLMAEINVLTSPRRGSTVPDSRTTARGDDRLIDELTYLTQEEASAMRERLGALSSDNTLLSLKNNLMRAVSAPYPTGLDRELALLSQIGISTNAGGSTGYNVSQLRGYLEINERTLDAALENKIPAIKQLFGNDTTGDLVADTGVAYNVDQLARPFVETGGIVALKTSTIDSRINQDERRIATLDRQLAAKEQELRIQYARMESAYARMEQMTTSLDNFNQQNRGNNR